MIPILPIEIWSKVYSNLTIDDIYNFLKIVIIHHKSIGFTHEIDIYKSIDLYLYSSIIRNLIIKKIIYTYDTLDSINSNELYMKKFSSIYSLITECNTSCRNCGVILIKMLSKNLTDAKKKKKI